MKITEYNLKKREISFDIARGIAIILMVIGHSGTPSYIKDFIYLFHIPAFYFISGHFFNDSYTNNKITFIKRKLIQLYKPFITYGIIFLILSPLFYKLHIINNYIDQSIFIRNILTTLIFQHVEVLLIPLWFLRSLFTVSVLFLFIRWANKKITPYNNLYSIIICITLFIIGAILGVERIHLPAQFQREFVALFFFTSGFFSRNRLYNHTNYILAIGLLIILSILALFIKVDLVGNYFNSILGLLTGAFIGIYLLIILSQYLAKKKNLFSVFLSFAGKNTISILSLHFLSFKLVSIILIHLYNLPIKSLSHWPTIHNPIIDKSIWWIFYSAVGIIIPLGCNYLITKIKRKATL